MYPTVEKFVASELKKVFTEAFISRIFELVKYDVSLLNEFNWYALSASYVALFNFESYCDCKLNVSTLFCVAPRNDTWRNENGIGAFRYGSNLYAV